jgi:nuclear pore complex protein Nup107
MHAQLMTMDDVEEALFPLKRIVDRVGKQIEEFAQKLDQFKPTDEGSTPHQKACALIREYQEVAQKTVEELRKSHQSNKNTLSNGHSVEETDAELRSWEQEARTWDLFADILSIDDPEVQNQAREADKIEDALHRYSTDLEKWNHLLATDTLAQECVAVLNWLYRTAEDSRESIGDVVAMRMKEIGDGNAVSAQALLYTREAIKAQKRLRSWPQPLHPDDPGIEVSLTRNSDKAPLVTQLDPDAPSRQGRKVQDPDEKYEVENWITCWEMLRRGYNWKDVMEWAEERSSMWKAGIMKGSNLDDEDSDGLLRFRNSRNYQLWQQMCSTIAKDESIEPWERAIHGLLSGELIGSTALFTDWSDIVFCHFNSAIVRLYSVFLQNYLTKYYPQEIHPDDFRVYDISSSWTSNCIEAIQRQEYSRKEARKPYNFVQGCIIGKLYEELFESQGKAFSAIANKTEVSKLYPKNVLGDYEEGAVEICADRNLVRIVTHMMLILMQIGRVDIGPCLSSYENIIVAYIEFLQKAGRIELIPLYASRLSKERSEETLSRVLINVGDHQERQQLVNLMINYGIDAAKVLQLQARYLLFDEFDDHRDSESSQQKTILVPRSGKGSLPDIKFGFIGEDITHKDELLIRSLEWHRCLEGHWSQICTIAITMFERCFSQFSQ